MKTQTAFRLIWTLYGIALGLTMVLLAGCSGMTLESRANATYDSYVAAQRESAQLMNDPLISEQVKLRIQRVDRETKPIADTLYAAIASYGMPGGANSTELAAAISAVRSAISSMILSRRPMVTVPERVEQ